MLLSDLQNFLSGLQGGASEGGVIGGRSIDLANAINAETLDKITSDAERSKLEKKITFDYSSN